MSNSTTSGASPRVFAASIVDLRTQIREALDFVGFAEHARADTRVFLKPNLTWKEHIPGVTVTPAFLEALVEVITDFTPHITIGESNGGYHGFQAEEAFETHGLYSLAKRYGVRVVNLSSGETERVAGVVDGVELELDLPKLLLHDVDLFTTVPVPKVHSNTIVSLAFKNQWGCIPNPMRLRLHPKFGPMIVFVNQTLRTRFAVFDAMNMLDVTGPLIGKTINKNLVIAANDPGAGSVACCRIMGIDPWSIAHHRTAERAGAFPTRTQEIVSNTPLEALCTHKFHLERNFISWVSYQAFNSAFLTRMIYDSTCADVCHKILYTVRKNKTAAKLLYGEMGHPAIEGKRR